MTTATDYVSAQLAASAGSAPFAGLTDDDLEELKRGVMHSLVLNEDEALDLHAQLRILRAEIRLRNAKQLEVAK